MIYTVCPCIKGGMEQQEIAAVYQALGFMYTFMHAKLSCLHENKMVPICYMKYNAYDYHFLQLLWFCLLGASKYFALVCL